MRGWNPVKGGSALGAEDGASAAAFAARRPDLGGRASGALWSDGRSWSPIQQGLFRPGLAAGQAFDFQ